MHKRYVGQITKTKAQTKNDNSTSHDQATRNHFGTRKSDDFMIKGLTDKNENRNS